MSQEVDTVNELELLGFNGFNGKIVNGLKCHVNKTQVLYPAGNKVVIQNMNKKEGYVFLSGHTNTVSCMTVSPKGKFVAAGQLSHMAAKSDLIVWEFESKQKFAEHSFHKGKVQDVSISASEIFMASIGGLDDGNCVVFSLQTKEPILSTPTTHGLPSLPILIKFSNNSDTMFVTGGKDTLRVWALDPETRQVFPHNTQFGHVKRDICCCEFDAEDKFMYCGTLTGDILKIRLNESPSPVKANRKDYSSILVNSIVQKVMQKKFMDGTGESSPVEGYYVGGVTAIQRLKTGNLIFGTGDGNVCHASEEVVVEQQTARLAKPVTKAIKKQAVYVQEIRRVNLKSGVTSIALRGEGHQFFVGTKNCEVFLVNLMDLSYSLLISSHSGPVKQVIFTPRTPEIFASCGDNIRVWCTATITELLRINIPNMVCSGIAFSPDGQSIVSGWNDGVIRSFTPESGKIIFQIPNAHMRGVNAIAVASDCSFIVSGGGEGSVRIWELRCKAQKLKATLQEHRGAVTAIVLRRDNFECATSSIDGCCIIWDLRRLVRVHTIISNTMFMCIQYHPSEAQIISCGTNRKISFWETVNAQRVREIDASDSGTLNAVDVGEDGEYCISAGTDKLLKMWKYIEGDQAYETSSHSGDVNSAKMSPGLQYMVSGCEDGSLFVWKYPVSTNTAAVTN